MTLEALREGKLAAISEAGLSRTTGEDFALSLLKKGLWVLKKKNEDVKNDRKGSEWKIALAYSIKGRSSVTDLGASPPSRRRPPPAAGDSLSVEWRIRDGREDSPCLERVSKSCHE